MEKIWTLIEFHKVTQRMHPDKIGISALLRQRNTKKLFEHKEKKKEHNPDKIGAGVKLFLFEELVNIFVNKKNLAKVRPTSSVSAQVIWFRLVRFT